jgi:hypothetical protein
VPSVVPPPLDDELLEEELLEDELVLEEDELLDDEVVLDDELLEDDELVLEDELLALPPGPPQAAKAVANKTVEQHCIARLARNGVRFFTGFLPVDYCCWLISIVSNLFFCNAIEPPC